ncbi:hypothetical protein [Microbacterium oleivorans]|uniref:Lipoprotein n=1 Tax=Microbacterium oleivorans TaxID=273677 RepID=A0A177KEC8_9MICO|nr:hypothetical protein [Microbacterium oleivorans]OAH51758.1 hypothetical protein AYL44_05885 [Microbacterium oleivorans]
MRRPHLLAVLVPVLVAGALSLAGCATGSSPAASPGGDAPSPTVTAACPVQPHAELPPECAPYDPDAAMEANEAYRDRFPLTDDQEDAAAPVADRVRAGLEELRGAGGFSEAEVVDLLVAEGLAGVQSRTGAGDVLFGAMTPAGACVHGALEAERVTVEVGGIIQDGGCLPAQ